MTEGRAELDLLHPHAWPGRWALGGPRASLGPGTLGQCATPWAPERGLETRRLGRAKDSAEGRRA